MFIKKFSSATQIRYTLNFNCGCKILRNATAKVASTRNPRLVGQFFKKDFTCGTLRSTQNHYPLKKWPK